MHSSTNYSQAWRRGVLNRCLPSLESAAIRTEDDDVLERNFQETPQNFLFNTAFSVNTS